MRCVMLTDWEVTGGAALAAYRLAEALDRAGHSMTRLVALPQKRGMGCATRLLVPKRTLLRRAAKKLMPTKWRENWNRGEITATLGAVLDELRPDVLSVHNLHDGEWAGWGHGMLEGVTRGGVAVVWTLHDMWSFTGRCIASEDCRKFLTGQGCDASCPTANEYPVLAPERIAGAWNERKEFFERRREIVAVTPSRWMAEQARAGLWHEHKIEVIPNGVPLEVYQPMKRAKAREELGLEAEGAVLLVAATVLSDRRAGGGLLAEALREVNERPLTLVTMGGGVLEVEVEGVRTVTLGYVEEERQRVLAYNAADVLVHPAPMGNLPNVIIEAMACGTPAVAFDVGGHAEAIAHGETGWLAEELTATSLAKAVLEATVKVRDGNSMREACRARAEKCFGDALQAERYVNLFRATQRELRN